MKGDGLSKLYDTLRLDERVRLRLAAWARRDRLDCDRLDRTCPAIQYDDYCARQDCSDVLVLGTLAELLPLLAKLQMIAAFRPAMEFVAEVADDGAALGYVKGYAAGWQAAGKRGAPPQIADDALPRAPESIRRLLLGVADELARTFATSARTPRDALAAFAEAELGVPLSDLLGAWAPEALSNLAVHAEALDAAEPDPEALALYGDVLRLAWRRHGLRDRNAEPDDELRERMEAALRRTDEAVDD
jgi:hypothetical protein